MSALYLVRDGDRTIALAVESNGKLYAYVPNVDAFVYNKPMSIDFVIDRNKQYEPIDGPAAAQIIHQGTLGKIDRRTSKTLLEWATTEQRRLRTKEVLDANTLRANVEPTPTDVAAAKADLVRKAPPGQWFIYKTYPADVKRQQALQTASHIRKGRIKAFADIDVAVKVVTSKSGDHVVQVSRQESSPAPPNASPAKRAAPVRKRKPTTPPERQRAAKATTTVQRKAQ